jgi:tripartite-type tricarboxylate transporter receptor subunit TctC
MQFDIYSIARGARPLAAALVALSALVSWMPDASAQAAFPTKPIRVIVPYAAGGAVDIVTRVVTQKMAETLKQSIIVDNRPGASTNIGSELAARAEPDGTTLLTASNTLAVNGALFPKLNYDPARDLVPVGAIGYAALVVVVPQDSPFKSMQDLIAFGKANPDKLSYASAGNGSSGHLASELLKQEAGFNALHVPYKGGAPAITDLLGGRISFMSINPVEVIGHIHSGKLRAIAVLDPNPAALLPGVPNVSTLHLPGSAASVWWGLVGPRGMPADTVARLNDSLRVALADPGVRKRLTELGATVTPGSAADFGNFVAAETVKWTRVVKVGKISPD